jgi:hypothetical protein
MRKLKHLRQMVLCIDTSNELRCLAALTGLQEVGLLVRREYGFLPYQLGHPGDPPKPRCPELGALTPLRQLTRLYSMGCGDVDSMGYGDDWKEFNCKVRQTRHDGQVLGGEITPCKCQGCFVCCSIEGL